MLIMLAINYIPSGFVVVVVVVAATAAALNLVVYSPLKLIFSA